MLRALGEDAVALRAEFTADIDDIQLFSRLHGRNLVFVSTDRKQLTREHEARAIRQAGVSALYFGPFSGRMRFWDQATWLVAKWPRIKGFTEGAIMGIVVEVKQNGKSVMYPS